MDLALAYRSIGAGSAPRVCALPVLPDYQYARPDEVRDEWCDNCHRILRRRLHHMPAEYEIQIRMLASTLGRVSLVLCAHVVGTLQCHAIINILLGDFHRSMLRTLAIGVTALAYHGWGFETALPRHRVVALLEHLWRNGPASGREQQRGFHINADTCRSV